MKKVCLCVLVATVVLISFNVRAQTTTKPVELKYGEWSPPMSGVAKLDQKMLDMIMEKSQGKIKITSYFAETLLKYPDVFRGTQSGVADISYWVIGTMGSPEKLSTVIRLPFNGINSMEMGTAVAEKLFRTNPELISEYKDLEVLGFRSMAIYHVHTVKKPVSVPADMKGMKVIASGGWVDYARVTGAAPVSLPIGDYYISLERGLVEGQYAHFPVCYIFKLLDVLKYHTVVKSSSIPDCFLINKNTWNSLSPDLQKIIRDAIQWRTAEAMRFDYEEEERAIDYAKKRGNKIYYPNADEMKLWLESAKPAHEIWIDKFEKEGLPARKIYESMVQIVNEYKK